MAKKYKIKQFDTKKDVWQQFIDNNVPVQLQFDATDFKCTKPPKVKMKDRDGKEFKPKKKT